MRHRPARFQADPVRPGGGSNPPVADSVNRPPGTPGVPGTRTERKAKGWHRRPTSLPVLVAVAGLVASACGGGSGGGGASIPSAGDSPRVGGTLSFAEFSAPVGLDPIVMTGSGVTGLIETTAVFDTLLRFNYDTGKYDAGTAESATSNEDATVWTIKLRSGVKFTDGTDYDADAVVFSMNRARSGESGAPPCAQVVACPRNTRSSSFPASFIKDVTAVDKDTVQVRLKQPWATFPATLATELGLVPSPTALRKCDASAPPSECAFNTAPVGAGPFMVTSFKPGESISMVRNPDYWGGQVYLDGLNFVNYADGGGAKTFAALQSGQVQAAFLRDPVAVASAHDAKFQGLSNLQYGGAMLLMNLATPTAGSSNLDVRKAVAAAIDPNEINQRAYQGKGKTSTQLLQSSFRWYPDVPGVTYDPEAAKTLVAAAKASGWDGKLRVLASNVPSNSAIGLALQAMLQNVGIDVALDNTKDTSAATALLVKGDFDVFVGGLALGNDDSGAIVMPQNFLSGLPSNRVGISDPVLDGAFKRLFAAGTDAEKKTAWAGVMTEFNAQVPAIPLAAIEEFIATSPKVHGLQQDLKTSVHLDKTWVG